MFSTTFRYALICLLELAQAEETLQAARIARKFDLSPHYLSVVLRELRRLGLIESQKGNRGGYRLLVAADAINLLFCTAHWQARPPIQKRIRSHQQKTAPRRGPLSDLDGASIRHCGR